MAAKFKKESKVKQVVAAPIEGTVVGHSLNDDGDVQYKVAYTDKDGVEHSRYFDEDQIESTEATEASVA